MRAAVLHQPAPVSGHSLALEDLPVPQPAAGEVLIRIEACGVCRTDLHIVTGELPPLRPQVTPGHQIVGHVAALGAPAPGKRASDKFGDKSGEESRESSAWPALGSRVGISWLGGVDGSCDLCRKGLENLCDHPVFTGYSVDGGYAEYALARADFCIPVPDSSPAQEVAPLLCAGIIGFRSLRVAGVNPGERVGLYGFGASAHLTIDVLKAWNCEVYVATRGASHQRLAESLGAKWVGEATAKPPVQLDRAVTFAPSGDVVIAALGALRKGGVVAINAIHLDRIPEFDYDSLLWGERQIRSVANMTRQDAHDFVRLAKEIGIKPKVSCFQLEQVNDALEAVYHDAVDGAAVVDCNYNGAS